MNRITIYILSILMMVSLISCQQGVIISREGDAVSRIVIPSNANEVEQHSSKVLQKYLKQITGSEFKIVTDASAARRNDINIGRVNRPELASIDFQELEEDGYVIRTDHNRLTIVGGSEKGTMYGVFGFLEKFLGCRKYTSKVSVIPTRYNISLDNVDVKEIPVFKYREVFYKDAYDPSFMEWHGTDKRNTDAYSSGNWGLWCHSTFSLLPLQEYAASHPEYYSLVNGKRLCDTKKSWVGEICWSNQEVYDIIRDNLKKRIDGDPKAKYWSISQMDNDDFCRCPTCMKAYEEYGSKQGTILPFINKMAREFPDKIISTLAYRYSVNPPTDIHMEKNTNIVLCNIGSSRHRPFDVANPGFMKILKNWYQIHDNLLIWDYVIGFHHLMAPFPNLRTLQPNLQLLHKNGVQAMFEQGNRETGGEFCELRAYLLAKLLWNPYQDVDVIIDDFLDGYYGAAGRFIREYIDLMHDKMEESNCKIGIFNFPWQHRDTYLTKDLINQYYTILDNAKEAVKDDAELLARVIYVKAQVDYAVLDIAKREVTGERGALEERDGQLVVKKDIMDLLQKTMRVCDLNGVTRMHEWGTPPMQFINVYLQDLEKAKLKIKNNN